jgi:hypothetical protein
MQFKDNQIKELKEKIDKLEFGGDQDKEKHS